MKKQLILFLSGCFVLFFLLIFTIEGAEPKQEKVFKAGAAVTDISPTEFPVSIIGGFTLRHYNTVRDPLHARAIIVDDGTTKFAIATIDCCLFGSELPKAIKKIVQEKTGFPADRISISATHTHFTPGLPYPVDKTTIGGRYSHYVVEKTAEAIIQANANLQPAQVGWSSAPDPRHVFCRRIIMKPGTALSPPKQFTDSKGDIAQMNPAKGSVNNISKTGTPDTNVYVLSFQTLDGKPLALLANYSTHYAGGIDAVSADYFGVFARTVAERLQAPSNFVAMMTNGTSGDTNCSDFFNAKQPAYNLEIVGKDIADTAMKALSKIKYTKWLPVRAVQEEITLALRRPTPEQVKEGQAWLENLKKEGKEVQTIPDVYASRTASSGKLPATRTIILQAVRVGDFGICTYPGEVFSFTGHDLRLSTPFTTNIIISHANGNNGYLPTAEQFELGGYTTWRGTSHFVPDSEPKIRARLLEMLGKLK